MGSKRIFPQMDLKKAFTLPSRSNIFFNTKLFREMRLFYAFISSRAITYIIN